MKTDWPSTSYKLSCAKVVSPKAQRGTVNRNALSRLSFYVSVLRLLARWYSGHVPGSAEIWSSDC